MLRPIIVGLRQMERDLKAAYDHCKRVTRAEAKNFYYASRTLPAKKRRAIYAAYAFCRLCDDIADGDLPLDEKRRLLEETRVRLNSDSSADAHPVFSALRDTIESYDIPVRHFDEVIEGVEMDLTQTRYGTFEELEGYCYRVASAVGLVCIEIFGYTDERAREYAVDLGLAMQLTNIIRDMREDSLRGRIYLPLDELGRFGYTEQDLERGVVNEPFRQLMRYQAFRAREHFERGRRIVPLLSADSRACLALLHGVYSSILDRIEASGFDVYSRRVGLPTLEKLLLMARLWAASIVPSLLAQARRGRSQSS